MKNLKKILASVLAFSMVASIASINVSAAATQHKYGKVLLQADFENATAIADEGLVSKGSKGTYTVEVDPADANNKVMKVVRQAAWAYGGPVFDPDSVNDDGNGTYLVEFDIYNETTSANIGLDLKTTGDSKACFFDYSITFDASDGTSKGGITPYKLMNKGLDGGQATKILYDTSVSTGKWMRVAYIFDPVNLKMHVFVNGQSVGYQSMQDSVLWKTDAANGTVTQNGVNYFGFTAFAAGKAKTIYYDNLKITRLDDVATAVTAPSVASAASGTATYYKNLATVKTGSAQVMSFSVENENTAELTVTPIAAAYSNGKLVDMLPGEAVTIKAGAAAADKEYTRAKTAVIGETRYTEYVATEGDNTYTVYLKSSDDAGNAEYIDATGAIAYTVTVTTSTDDAGTETTTTTIKNAAGEDVKATFAVTTDTEVYKTRTGLATSKNTKVSMDVSELLVDGVDEIKLFVWDGVSTMVPVSTSVTIK